MVLIMFVLMIIVMALWLLPTTTTATTTPCSTNPSSVETQALQSLFDSTNGSHWKWNNASIAGKIWDFNTLNPNPCNNWQGIGCTRASLAVPCHVTTVLLDGYGLQGTLPTNLGNLQYLTVLQLSTNPLLNGSIPSTLGNMKGLIFLKLFSNALRGIIPTSITQLGQLQSLILHGNELDGRIPQDIGNMANLTILELDTNHLTGTIPTSITKLKKLQRLYLFDNFLDGSIPEAIGSMTSLTALALYSNHLTGIIPTSITQLTQLQFMYLYTNHLDGHIPEAIGNMASLSIFSVGTNLFTGTIPTSITQLTKLRYLYLYGNNIDGSIPEAIGNIKRLLLLNLYQNHLTGTIPTSITQLSQLQRFYLNVNHLDGPIPEAIGNMSSLSILSAGNNHFAGTIPTSITKLTNFTVLYFNSNDLNGSIPDAIGNMTSLVELDLFGNRLTGTIPTSITKLTKLTALFLNENDLDGSIPEAIGNMTSLIDLSLPDNHLTGTIPTSITQLRHLTVIYLFENKLDGSLPEEIGNLKNLLVLNVGANHLTGTIPTSITQLKKLQRLYLYINNFVGCIPEDIGNMINLLYISASINHLAGTIPTSITQLKKLERLYAFDNYLNGSIPEAIGSMTSLTTLDLNKNYMTGTIPTSITQLSQLQFMYLNTNELDGSIPDTIGNMTNLIILSLNTNHLTGTIPTSSTKLIHLAVIYLYENDLEGRIPQDIGNMANLTILELDTNHLTGTIPTSITELKQLQRLFLFDNFLDGSIPEAIGSMTSLTILDAAKNYLIGTIPTSITRLIMLQYLYLKQNMLTGSIPGYMGEMSLLKGADLSSNELKSSIPDSIVKLRSLQYLSLFQNQLTGRIPSGMGSLYELTLLELTNNWMTGEVNAPPNAVYFDINNNLYHGNVSWMTTLTSAVSLLVSSNIFTGSLPSSYELSRNLTYFQAAQNHFSGSIVSLFDPSRQSLLQVLDLSDNVLTGSLPTSLFEFANLTFVILAQNCFTGSIPATVCSPRHSLKVLVMDGLHAASSCQTYLFPGIPQIHTLADTHAITGSIPGCLFGEMVVLQTLHISGNGLTGSLPDAYTKLGSTLQQLSLSHNVLTGSIPRVFQEHGFTEMDVSFNLLTGELNNDMNVTGYERIQQQEGSQSNDSSRSTIGLRLNNNRLSGTIPSVLLDLETIEILAGNIFGCDNSDRAGTLPQHDPEFNTYMCGSEEANNAMITYAVFVAAVLIIICVITAAYYLWMRKSNGDGDEENVDKSIVRKMYAYVEDRSLMLKYSLKKYDDSIAYFVDFVSAIHNHIMLVTGVIVGVFVLAYGVMGEFFSTYEQKYAWTVSIGYLSGVIPGACLLVLMICIISLMVLRDLRDPKQIADQKRKSVALHDVGHEVHLDSKSLALALFFVVLNVVVVITVNANYVVLIVSGISTSEQTILTIAIALFKDGWRWLVMGSTKWKVMHDVEVVWGADRMMGWLLFVCLFNNIVAPFIATAFVNTNCFYYAVIPGSNVEYSNAGNEIEYCERYSLELLLATDNKGSIIASHTQSRCRSYGHISISTSYQPSFTYAYQCTSTLLSIFAPVWIYMFLFGGIIAPLFNLLVYFDITKVAAADKEARLESKTLSVYSWVLNRINMFISLARNEAESKNRTVFTFNYRQQVVLLCNNLAILLSFGVLFPPIAVVGCISIWVQLMMQKLLVLDLVSTCNTWLATHVQSASEIDPTHDNDVIKIAAILQRTETSCAKFPDTFYSASKSIVLYVSVIWGLFLWDIVGGEVGLILSLWVFVLMVIAGRVLRYSDYWVHYYMNGWGNSQGNGDEREVTSNRKEGKPMIELGERKLEAPISIVNNPLLIARSTSSSKTTAI